uniref:PIH1 domain-containing protein n=1 Tax=Dracunculus medinensis TaxID=318479 RepID=A0A0N4UP68_DRAME
LFGESKCKLFLNICHCINVPRPIEDYDEDKIAEIIDSDDPGRYRIPLSVGELECIRDNRNENCAKIDIIVNSTFYAERLEISEFFRQLLLLILTDALDAKHKIKIDLKKAVQLKNRRVMGDLSTQRIKKEPANKFIQETVEPAEEENLIFDNYLPRNCLLFLKRGKEFELLIKFPKENTPIEDPKRLCLKINDDRLVLILDRRRTIADVYFPFKINYDNPNVELFVDKDTLRVTAAVVW